MKRKCETHPRSPTAALAILAFLPVAAAFLFAPTALPLVWAVAMVTRGRGDAPAVILSMGT